MRKILFLAAMIFEFSKLHASSLMTLNEEDVHVPVVTYDLIRENGFLDKQWGNLQLEGEKWHFHWALKNEGSIEERFAPEHYDYETVLIDSSGLRDLSKLYRFASYRVVPTPKEEGLCSSVLLWLPQFFTFYLIDPKTCRMHHG